MRISSFTFVLTGHSCAPFYSQERSEEASLISMLQKYTETRERKEYLYKSCQSIWWLCGRLSCVLEPLLEGIHAQLLQLILNLLLLAPATGFSSSPAGRVASTRRTCVREHESGPRLQAKSTPDDSTQLVATRIEGSALLLIVCGHATYSFSSCSG